MLNKIKNFLSGEIVLNRDKDGKDIDRSLMVAIGVLMLEMAGADDDFAPEEVKTCFRSLEKQFGLTDAEAMNILEEADSKRSSKEEVSKLIESINELYSDDQKQLIIALIWKVVVADEQIEKYELRIANQLRVRLQLSEEQAEEARTMAFSSSV